MKLMKLQAWADKVFSPESRPSLPTLYKWANEGDIPVQKIGRQIFVEVSDDGKTTFDSAIEAARLKLIS